MHSKAGGESYLQWYNWQRLVTGNDGRQDDFQFQCVFSLLSISPHHDSGMSLGSVGERLTPVVKSPRDISYLRGLREAYRFQLPPNAVSLQNPCLFLTSGDFILNGKVKDGDAKGICREAVGVPPPPLEKGNEGNGKEQHACDCGSHPHSSTSPWRGRGFDCDRRKPPLLRY